MTLIFFDKQARNPSNNVTNIFVKALAKGPNRTTKSYPMYFVNGYKFHTIGHGTGRATMNSGVCIKGTNYSENASDYYGQLIEILELEYPSYPFKRTVLFKCDWFDPSRHGTRRHPNYSLVEVNQSRRFNKYEPFILAMKACQVYYVPYPSLRRAQMDWIAVCKIKARAVVEMPELSKKTSSMLKLAFQDNEINLHQIEVVEDNDLGLLNDPNGGDIGYNVGDDEFEFEYKIEHVLESESEDEDDDEDFADL